MELWKKLRANKTSLNAFKTEIIINFIFKTNTENITKKFKFRLRGQNINLTEQVKHIGLLNNNMLTSDCYLNFLINKLNCAIGLFAKIQYYTPKFWLNTCQSWGQKYKNSEKLQQLSKYQDQALHIIHFFHHSRPSITSIKMKIY